MAKKDTAVAVAVSAEVPDYLNKEHESYRIENDNDLVQPPRLKILQPLSDEVAKSQLAKAGDIWVGEQGCVIPEKSLIVPIMAQKEWVKFDKRKFLWSTKDPNDQRIKDEGEEAFKTQVLNFLVIAPYDHPDILPEPNLMTFSGTSFKAGKKLYNNSYRVLKTPPFSHLYELTTQSHDGPKGVWHTPELRFMGYVKDPEVYKRFEAIYRKFVTSDLTAAPDESQSEEHADTGAPEGDDDLPF